MKFFASSLIFLSGLSLPAQEIRGTDLSTASVVFQKALVAETTFFLNAQEVPESAITYKSPFCRVDRFKKMSKGMEAAILEVNFNSKHTSQGKSLSFVMTVGDGTTDEIWANLDCMFQDSRGLELSYSDLRSIFGNHIVFSVSVNPPPPRDEGPFVTELIGTELQILSEIPDFKVIHDSKFYNLNEVGYSLVPQCILFYSKRTSPMQPNTTFKVDSVTWSVIGRRNFKPNFNSLSSIDGLDVAKNMKAFFQCRGRNSVDILTQKEFFEPLKNLVR